MICSECQKDCVESDICPQCESCRFCCECELLWDHRNYEEEEEYDDDE